MTTTDTTTTTTTETTYPIHFLGPLTIVTSGSGGGQGQVTEYGSEMIVTPEFHDHNRDRNGDSFLDVLGDESAQIKRWGRVLVQRGPWPDNVSRVEPGSQRWRDDYEAARKEAHQMASPEKRDARLSDLRKQYGPAPTTSTTLASYGRQAGSPAPEAVR